MERDEKMIHQEFDLKQELAQQAGSQKSVKDEVKLTKNMTIPDMVKVMMPEIKKALPTVLTPERFTRIALSALNNTPALQKCTPMSFLAALMNAAQLGLEPNTPLGQAYLIPYKNKGVLECQFQIGYKGLIDLAYRNGQMQTIQAQAVYEMMSFLMNMDWNRNCFTDQLFLTEESWSIFMEFSVLSMEVMGWQL